MTRDERIKYIYDECRKVGITHHGAVGLLGNLQGESSQFDPMSLETLYANRFKLTDEEYTRRADAGEKVYNSKTFVFDSAGYGIAQWTWWDRKRDLRDFAHKLGKSVGDLTAQVAYMFHEMQTRYKKTWATLTATDDYREAVKICVTEYEKPANTSAAIQTRTGYAKTFLNLFAEAEVKPEPDTGKVEKNANAEQAKAALVSVLEAELGYIEKRSNSQLEDKTANVGSGNYTKYAAHIDANYPNFYNGPKQGAPWCDVFADDAFIVVFGYETTLKLLCTKERSSGAGCEFSADYFRAAGQFHKTPEVGDQIFFGPYGDEYHTGLVVEVSADSVTTIEGNTSPDEGVVANGGMVCKKTYPLNYHSISGYGRPDYSIVEKILVDAPELDEPVEGVQPEPAPTPTPTPEPETSKPVEGPGMVAPAYWPPRELYVGMLGPDVVAWQGLLVAHGYKIDVDGDFGSKTRVATMAFQAEHGLEPDGIAGPLSWAAITKRG